MAYNKLRYRLKEKYQLAIVGKNVQNEYYKLLNRMVSDNKDDDRVIFLGEIKYPEIISIYRSASLYVLPSKVENFPFTVLEAMSEGLPVIGSNSTGCAEAIGDNGLLFDPSNVDELAEKMEQLLLDDKLRIELIERGNSWVREFTLEKMALKTLKVFKESMGIIKRINIRCLLITR